MGIISKLLHGSSEDKIEFKHKLKSAQQDKKIQDLIEERSKSSNRRALEREMRDQEEAKIKIELDKINKKRNSEMWKSKNSIISGQSNILKDDRPILKEKNIFLDHKSDIPFVQQRGMFFK